MLRKLSDRVWFGNWESPFEAGGIPGTIINVAHHFSERRQRNTHWQRLPTVPWETIYVRLAKKDSQPVDKQYMVAMALIVKAAEQYHPGRPILTHCQMGGHRGPTAAMLVQWILDDCTEFACRHWHKQLQRVCPQFTQDRPVRHLYYPSALAYMRENSK